MASMAPRLLTTCDLRQASMESDDRARGRTFFSVAALPIAIPFFVSQRIRTRRQIFAWFLSSLFASNSFPRCALEVTSDGCAVAVLVWWNNYRWY